MKLAVRSARVVSLRAWFIPVHLDRPLEFGASVVTAFPVLRVAMDVALGGESATGWGDVPMMAPWFSVGAEPDDPWEPRFREAAAELAELWSSPGPAGILPFVLDRYRRLDSRAPRSPLPELGMRVASSAFEAAWLDALGKLNGCSSYGLIARSGADARAAAAVAVPSVDAASVAAGLEILGEPPAERVPFWHLAGLSEDDLRSLEAALLGGGVRNLKVKLPSDPAGAVERLSGVLGRADAALAGADWTIGHVSVDFNGGLRTADDLAAFLDGCDRLGLSVRLDFIEQPFLVGSAAEGALASMDTRGVALYADESALRWEDLPRLLALGYRGVAIKTCKGLCAAALMLATAKALGLGVAVQDLTNPMLAQLVHVGFASRSGVAWGLESNSMQYCPAASGPEAAVHPGAFARRDGALTAASLMGPGLGYRIDAMRRDLPAPTLDAVYEVCEVCAER